MQNWSEQEVGGFISSLGKALVRLKCWKVCGHNFLRLFFRKDMQKPL